MHTDLYVCRHCIHVDVNAWNCGPVTLNAGRAGIPLHPFRAFFFYTRRERSRSDHSRESDDWFCIQQHPMLLAQCSQGDFHTKIRDRRLDNSQHGWAPTCRHHSRWAAGHSSWLGMSAHAAPERRGQSHGPR